MLTRDTKAKTAEAYSTRLGDPMAASANALRAMPGYRCSIMRSTYYKLLSLRMSTCGILNPAMIIEMRGRNLH